MNLKEIDTIEIKKIDGAVTTLGEYAKKTLLIVNTASECGFTPQYEGLEKVYQRYKDEGFAVLGFPCNQFGEQEKGSNDEISQFCKIRHGVTFPLFSKIEVNGENTHPLFTMLKEAAPGLLGSLSIKWNFTKFLINSDRTKVIRFAPSTKPDALTGDIETFLEEQ